MVHEHERVIFGRGQIICRDASSGVLWAGSDPRADGLAMTFLTVELFLLVVIWLPSLDIHRKQAVSLVHQVL
jgi:hypothetical protein